MSGHDEMEEKSQEPDETKDTNSEMSPGPQETAGKIDFSLRTRPGSRVRLVVEVEGGQVVSHEEEEEVEQALGRRGLLGRIGQRSVGRDTDLGEQHEVTRGKEVKLPDWWQSLKLFFARLSREQWLFALAMVLYLITRFVHLVDFPIYFFCDEAVQTVLAADLVRDGFRDYEEQVLPTYFKDGSNYCMGTTVYLQVLPTMIFGRSVLVTRAVEVLIGSLTALWISLILKNFLKSNYWWSGPLLLAFVPTWFLHSRTAFGFSIMAAFYSGFLYYYLRYRLENARFLYHALVLGALTFYTYAPGQMIMLISGLLLLGIDWRYHWEHKKNMQRGFLLLVLLVLPQIRFMVTHSDDFMNRFRMYDSYWAQGGTFIENLGVYFLTYLKGLNPVYWFFSHEQDLPLFTMKGHGHIPWLMLPFFAWGLFLTVKQFCKAENRLFLIAIVASPAGAAFVDVEARRMLTMVIPVVVITAIGLTSGLNWLQKRRSIRDWRMQFWTFSVIGLASLLLMSGALREGPTWYENYKMSGMQYGSRQVFEAAREHLRENPKDRVLISLSWTYQSNVIEQFFNPDDERMSRASPTEFIENYDLSNNGIVFIVTEEEYQQFVDSNRFKTIDVLQVLPYPNDEVGFYVVRLFFLDDIEEVIQEELRERFSLRESQAEIGDQIVVVRHTMPDGDIENAFDGDLESLVKTQSLNPFVIELEFPEPRQLQGLKAHVGSGPAQVSVTTTDASGETSQVYTRVATQTADNKIIEIDFGETQEVATLHFELLEINGLETSVVHLWELELLE